jgi:hypothetical protein
MKRPIWLLVFTLFLIIPSDSPAQVDNLSPGRRIRIDYDTTVTKDFLLLFKYHEKELRSIRGDLISITGDSICIRDEISRYSRRRFAISDIRKLYISTGTKRATLNGLLWGGGLSSLLMALTLSGPEEKRYYEDTNRCPTSLDRINCERVVLFISTCTFLGGIIGYFTKIDDWQKIETEDLRLKLDFDLKNDQFQFGLAYSF